MARRALPWVGLLAGLLAIAGVTSWWLAVKPDTSAGSLASLTAGPPEREPVPAEGIPGRGSLLVPEETEPEVAVRSALLADRRPARAPLPTVLRIPSLGIEAPVVGVGVDPETRELAVPGDRSTVAWYRFSASPGQPGSAVLAAHVDYGEGRAVFFHLASLEPGALVEVGFRNGSLRRFRVVARRLYEKDALPARVFARGGKPVLALITCGGGYDYSSRSYDGNVVVYAIPADGPAF